MKKNFTLFAAIMMVTTGILSGCGNSEKKEAADQEAHASKYQEMAAQRGMSRGAGAGGAGSAAPGQATPGAPAGN
jgi:outer membrane murein-binding lipoprotein Lpp